MLKHEDFYLAVGELREAVQIAIDSNGLYGLNQLQALVDNLEEHYPAGKVENPESLLRVSGANLKTYWISGKAVFIDSWRWGRSGR